MPAHHKFCTEALKLVAEHNQKARGEAQLSALGLSSVLPYCGIGNVCGILAVIANSLNNDRQNRNALG